MALSAPWPQFLDSHRAKWLGSGVYNSWHRPTYSGHFWQVSVRDSNQWGKSCHWVWNFGYDPDPILGNPANTIANAPRSYTTNDKYNNANGIPTPTVPQKFAALVDADVVTKLVLVDQVENLLETLEIDNGVYESATSPTCKNYSVGGGNSDVICPL